MSGLAQIISSLFWHFKSLMYSVEYKYSKQSLISFWMRVHVFVCVCGCIFVGVSLFLASLLLMLVVKCKNSNTIAVKITIHCNIPSLNATEQNVIRHIAFTSNYIKSCWNGNSMPKTTSLINTWFNETHSVIHWKVYVPWYLQNACVSFHSIPLNSRCVFVLKLFLAFQRKISHLHFYLISLQMNGGFVCGRLFTICCYAAEYVYALIASH